MDDVEPPFIFMKDEKGGHCPYGWTKYDIFDEWDCVRFFKEMAKWDKKILIERYKKSINRSVKIFKKWLKQLERRNLLDSTLIIFSSDHGELLGEYGGAVEHGCVTCPELIYVPTIFIHPSLNKNIDVEKNGVFRHVNLYPTICDVLNIKIQNNIDCVSLFRIKKLPRHGFSYYYETNKFTSGIKSIIKYNLIEKGKWNNNYGIVVKHNINNKILLIRFLFITFFYEGLHSSSLSKR